MGICSPRHACRRSARRAHAVFLHRGLIAVVLACVLESAVAADQNGGMARETNAAEPITPIVMDARLDPRRVELGGRLFGDARLSGNGDRACTSCHPLDRAGMDGRPRGIAIDGQARLRNTPTVFNAALNDAFNWDGASATLEEHARRLLANPNVMNAQWSVLLSRLRADRHYASNFPALYPDGITEANVVDALVSFERSLITPNARLDRYLRGETNALDAEELRGYQRFKAYGCVACHQGMNVGGNLFQRFGIFQRPDGDRTQTDPGRFNVTQIERDRGVFRVPSLRNVALTAPYFHDGSAATLDVAVERMARYQLGRKLPSDEVHAIVRFLHTLTGEYPAGQPLGGRTAR